MSQELNNINSGAVPPYIDPFDIWRGHIPHYSDTQGTSQFLDFMINYFTPEEDNSDLDDESSLLDGIMEAIEDSGDEESDDDEPKGLMEWQIQELSTHKCTEEESKDEMCVICIVDFEKDAALRMLPCKHKFHTKCIDQWLANNSKCPICRTEMLDYII